MNKKDILTRKDIELLVNTFYDKVKVDSSIGFFFNEIIPVQWEKHLPRMYDFWENVLFHSGTYEGNPLQAHAMVNEKSKISKAHFDQWTLLFNTTVDELFKGINAEMIKQRALSIATVMQIKIVY